MKNFNKLVSINNSIKIKNIEAIIKKEKDFSSL